MLRKYCKKNRGKVINFIAFISQRRENDSFVFNIKLYI